jgi:hypothetical protein
MSQTFQCGDNPALVGYLYDECEPGERAVIAAHVAICAACAAELAALDSTRIQLKAWGPPEGELGFAIVRPQAQGPRPEGGARGLRPGPWFARPLPAWAQVAAASLIFGAGLWLGIVRGSQPGSFTASAAPASVNTTTASATDLTDLERRLRAEMAQIRTASSAASAPQAASEGQLLARVREMIAESERRQQNQLAMRTAQVVRDFDTQRRADLTQIQNSFGQIEGLTGAEAREQRQMLNYLMRVSQQR